jgi:hypothetical protein
MRQLVRGQDTAALEQKIEGMRIQMQEQKTKYKELTMQLAQKIVLLEE